MGMKTIGLRDDVYERLKARKREGESFSGLLNRLLEETTPDWREGFGTLNEGESDELQRAAVTSPEEMSDSLSARQQEALDELTETEDADETS